MNVLFLKENVHPQRLQLSYGLKKCYRVSSKTGDGLCYDYIYQSGTAVGQESLEIRPVFIRACECLIGVHTCVLPTFMNLNQLTVVADLCRE
jgi:hypothetical protein